MLLVAELVRPLAGVERRGDVVVRGGGAVVACVGVDVLVEVMVVVARVGVDVSVHRVVVVSLTMPARVGVDVIMPARIGMHMPALVGRVVVPTRFRVYMPLLGRRGVLHNRVSEQEGRLGHDGVDGHEGRIRVEWLRGFGVFPPEDFVEDSGVSVEFWCSLAGRRWARW
jgi:hypothetical protein